jgi:hypothetical protein
LTASNDYRGGGGKECVEDLILDGEEGWNKWLADGVNEAWVMMDFKGEDHTVRGISLKSANDAPHRDPQVVQILAWNKMTDQWQHIQTFEPKFLEKRWCLAGRII